MSEIREELEKNFASAETQSEDNSEVSGEQTQVSSPEVDEYMDAPKAYTKEYQESFKTLSPEWRKYLTEREKQVERGFSDAFNKANAYNWVNDSFNSRKDRLVASGINRPQEYFGMLAKIDDALTQDPAGTLRLLAQSYGVDFNNTNTDISSLWSKIKEIQDGLNSQETYIREQQRSNANKAFMDFTNAKDDAGNLKHRYWQDVRQDMYNIIKSGMANNLEDAYKMAIWTNENVRNKLIDERSQSQIDSKIAEAGKAKNASFSPKSKAEPAERELTRREEIEKLFREAGL